MKVALLPVKDLSACKERLALLLSKDQRRELMWTLFQHTADVLQRAAALAGSTETAVVTPDAQVAGYASRLGWRVLREKRSHSESRSVDWACGQLMAAGAEAVLRLPCDLPLLQPADIATLWEQGGADCLLVPSRSGHGTNALLRTPPDAFPSRFGPESRKLHEEEARRRDVPLRILDLPAVALDLDTRDDLKYFQDTAPSPHPVLDLLSGWELQL